MLRGFKPCVLSILASSVISGYSVSDGHSNYYEVFFLKLKTLNIRNKDADNNKVMVLVFV